ncbi:hypothetical protein ASPACDRAFT_38167 [Aspergillus aculeatus ATCC 16872]|uniref:Pre-mRNA-splicing factor 18 n=1 Tax=Aspergillus aculeatus (strain ATCC 16872 / CBS 172.66 / WB 5094) TaxID=690307 RepID=A0A1L9X836_ASPA1|nr:uncharacterized protein ASPACDRAFT_38167 [Aspergillus aculeatus ATCC 16872]OJK04605.1 hypothetical protein ASPACDRAFT_38167 [Aspergillus aculeatus ATCC 16872]
MDFAALMSKEISKAKATATANPKPQNPSPSPTPTTSTEQKKYTRRADLEAARLAAYNEEQARLAAERAARQAQKRKAEDEEAARRREREDKKRRLAEESRRRREEEDALRERERRRRLGLPELTPSEGEGSEAATGAGAGEEELSAEEVKQRLRELGEPATLFGEGEKARARRYWRVVRKDDQPDSDAVQKQKWTDGPIPTTLELVPEVEMKIPATLPKDDAGKKFLFRQLASYFTMVLKEWEAALAKRDVSVKQSLQGRQAFNAMVQSRENMKPLFRKFEKGDLDTGVLEHVVEIVHKAQLRRYVDANDAYLRLSIGKAAWPIGVTMVGIHERSAREKLHQSDQQAHILSDESTRKYLQSIKRCLSFAQTRWPPDDQLQIMG